MSAAEPNPDFTVTVWHPIAFHYGKAEAGTLELSHRNSDIYAPEKQSAKQLLLRNSGPKETVRCLNNRIRHTFPPLIRT
ncbi:hypothetical protein SAMN05444141_104272 [Pseudovibrio denitrificans]|uniref:Uncharacterized protein n=1 Tax=Pseudovibrio denitrificans TaxID=258256 RepID=A0A1I7BSP0_9HYPH|nr:hypothetical protein SAMN05444141_104272 [Pseudovibrio denitrificans]